MITVFQNLYKTKDPYYKQTDSILEQFKTDKYAILEARECDNFAHFKKELPIVCFGGEFFQRSNTSLNKASGFIILDFDKVQHLEEKKVALMQSKYAYSVFISPSGNGLKALIKIPIVKSDSEYKEYYSALLDEFDGLDESGKDISRACFWAFDPDIYINKK